MNHRPPRAPPASTPGSRRAAGMVMVSALVWLAITVYTGGDDVCLSCVGAAMLLMLIGPLVKLSLQLAFPG